MQDTSRPPIPRQLVGLLIIALVTVVAVTAAFLALASLTAMPGGGPSPRTTERPAAMLLGTQTALSGKAATDTEEAAPTMETAQNTARGVSSVGETPTSEGSANRGVKQPAPKQPVTLNSLTPGPSPTINALLPLLGRRIGLDPGHGPRGDLGAVLVDPGSGQLIMSEAEFNLDVALRCRDILRARGAGVVLTRENADTFTAPWPVDANGDGIVGGPKDDLQERVDILNAFHAEAFLSIHVNNAPDQPYTRGVQAFYCSTGDCPIPSQSKQLGQLVLDQLQEKLANAGYPVKSAELHSDFWLDPLHLFLLGPLNPPTHVRATQMPGVLSESLYLSSPAEAVQLQHNNVRQAVALAYADALQSFLNGSANGR